MLSFVRIERVFFRLLVLSFASLSCFTIDKHELVLKWNVFHKRHNSFLFCLQRGRKNGVGIKRAFTRADSEHSCKIQNGTKLQKGSKFHQRRKRKRWDQPSVKQKVLSSINHSWSRIYSPQFAPEQNKPGSLFLFFLSIPIPLWMCALNNSCFLLFILKTAPTIYYFYLPSYRR